MSDAIFPFDLDGVKVVGEVAIEFEGRVWRPATGRAVGQWQLRPDWLRSGARVDAPEASEVWESDGQTLEPSVGPAWEGIPYVPAPSYVREQILRRRAGLPIRARRWLPRDPKALRRQP